MTPDEQSPKIKILNKEDYTEYKKFSNFNNYANGEQLAMINIEPKAKESQA